MSLSNPPKSEFKPSKKPLHRSSVFIWISVKPSWSTSGKLFLIAFVSWDTGLDSSSSKIEPYRFSIIGCISQNFPRFASGSSSAALDSYAVNVCSNLLLTCSLPGPTTKLIGSEFELTAAWTFTPLRRLCPLYLADSPPFLNRWGYYQPPQRPSLVFQLRKHSLEQLLEFCSKHLLSTTT